MRIIRDYINRGIKSDIAIAIKPVDAALRTIKGKNDSEHNRFNSNRQLEEYRDSLKNTDKPNVAVEDKEVKSEVLSESLSSAEFSKDFLPTSEYLNIFKGVSINKEKYTRKTAIEAYSK